MKIKVKQKNKSVEFDLPQSRQALAEILSSIGIETPPNSIYFSKDKNDNIELSLTGETEFERRLVHSVQDDNTLSTVNTCWTFFNDLPMHAKTKILDEVMSEDIDTFNRFGLKIIDNRRDTVLEKYYCPLVVSVYHRNDYGDINEEPVIYGGNFAAQYEEEIRDLIAREDSYDENDLAEYFDGRNSAVSKLQSVKFSTQNVNGILYGCIRAELTEKFIPEEEAEFKDWLEGQCSDGYGEGLEQREINIDDGEMYVSFWNSDNYFLLNDSEFDEYLINQNQGMGGIK